ncbi:MAG: ImmA/IrrE family metallo-endopeptidase [Acidobacteriaceae bacterium]|nr:ImmA/IrrE family metallo-endopeptidase [Acidobacteriaceae bacterium]
MTRAQWKMLIGPVLHLIRWLEAAGCVVIEEDFGTARVDGLSQWIGDHPVILINSALPTDRKRLTLVHALGHLCLHSSIATVDMEEEANAFAAEFLMSEHVIRPELRSLSLGKLIDLKREWGFPCKLLLSAPTVSGSSSRVIVRASTGRSIGQPIQLYHCRGGDQVRRAHLLGRDLRPVFEGRPVLGIGAALPDFLEDHSWRPSSARCEHPAYRVRRRVPAPVSGAH